MMMALKSSDADTAEGESFDLETTKSTESMEASTDEDTAEGESTDLETTKSTESTEASTEEGSPTPKKRKIGMSADYGSSDEEEEEVEEEEEMEEEEEEEKKKKEDSCESDQAWGFDSFDGSDYDPNTDEDDEDFEWNRYFCHVYHSRGFKVDEEIVPKGYSLGLGPFHFDAEFLPNVNPREYMDDMVKLALDQLNQRNGTNVTCDHIVRVMVKWCAGLKSYITFMARESPQGDLIEYQAKTQWKVWQKNAHAILCRPAPPMKPIPERYLQKMSEAAELAALAAAKIRQTEWS
ncbi:unnamed protein product [Microthlaspi erraticum]|uniref:Uncharacterized protein n=1 Tax=Microthlaspi erraticum TaxID=1685480 RepID=A0A6D2JDP9_9BRAS|nr:unnamed protein product [Microthlaspi erraticum]